MSETATAAKARRQSLRNVVYAVVTNDGTSGTEYGAIKRLPGAINATINPSVNTESLYADDGEYEYLESFAGADMELSLVDIPLEDQAAILGHTYDQSKKMIVRKSNDHAPYIAIGFLSEVFTGTYRVVWMLKGKFTDPESTYATAEENPAWNTPSMSGHFIRRLSDDEWQREIDVTTAEAAQTNLATVGGAQ